MNGKVRDGDGLKEREGYKQRRRTERERESGSVCVCVLQTACWNERADRELPVCRLHHRLILRGEDRGTGGESEGRSVAAGRW